MSTCIVPGCGREVHARNLCHAHDTRARKGQSLDAPIRPRSVNGTRREQMVMVRVHRDTRAELVTRALAAHTTIDGVISRLLWPDLATPAKKNAAR